MYQESGVDYTQPEGRRQFSDDMPMGFHNFYMAMLIIGFIGNIVTLFQGLFSDGGTTIISLGSLVLPALTLYALWNRKSFIVTLMWVQFWLGIAASVVITFGVAILCFALGSYLGSEVGAAAILVFIAVFIGVIIGSVFNYCVVVYYKKRRHLFIN